MTNLTDDLDVAVGVAFSPTQKTAAIASGLRYASGLRQTTIADGDSANSDLAVSLYAAAILFNQRSMKKYRTDATITVKTLDQMWTKQMNDLLFGDIQEKSIRLSNKSPSQFAPGKRWQDGVSG